MAGLVSYSIRGVCGHGLMPGGRAFAREEQSAWEQMLLVPSVLKGGYSSLWPL